MGSEHELRGQVPRIVLAVAALAVSVVCFWAMASDGTAGNASAAQYQYGKKVTICHRTGSGKRVTITISRNALPAHLRHGDTTGPCPTTAASRKKAERAGANESKADKGAKKAEKSKPKAKGSKPDAPATSTEKAAPEAKPDKPKGKPEAKKEKGQDKGSAEPAAPAPQPAPAQPQPAPAPPADEGKGNDKDKDKDKGGDGGNGKGGGKK
jgi:hypothetical protein